MRSIAQSRLISNGLSGKMSLMFGSASVLLICADTKKRDLHTFFFLIFIPLYFLMQKRHNEYSSSKNISNNS